MRWGVGTGLQIVYWKVWMFPVFFHKDRDEGGDNKVWRQEVEGLILAPSCNQYYLTASRFVKHLQRAQLGHSSLRERQLSKYAYVFLLIIVSQQIGGMPLFLMQRSAFASPSVSPEPRDSSDKAVILLNNAKFVQASSGAPRCLFGHWRRNFPLGDFPGENGFLLVLFYRHRWKWVTAVRVTVFLSGKYWCICEKMLKQYCVTFAIK